MAVITSLQRAVSSRHGSASYSKDLTCVCGWVGTACCSLSHDRGAFKRIHMYQPRQLEAFDAQRKSTTLRLERSLRSCRFMNRCVATHSGAHSHYQAEGPVVVKGAGASSSHWALSQLYPRSSEHTSRHLYKAETLCGCCNRGPSASFYQPKPVSWIASYLCARLTIQRYGRMPLPLCDVTVYTAQP